MQSWSTCAAASRLLSPLTFEVKLSSLLAFSSVPGENLCTSLQIKVFYFEASDGKYDVV